MDDKGIDQNAAHNRNAKHQAYAQDDRIAVGNKRKEIQFKASHALLIIFFSWILYISPGHT